jgi:hypothetical protein
MWESIESDRTSEQCFADEVAIDFPSVGLLTERVRASFLGDDRRVDTLTTEVSLSSRDASIGTVIPLAVPLRGMCGECGGRGGTWTEPCGACCGSGESVVHHPVRVTVPPGVSNGARIRFRVKSPVAASARVELRVSVLRSSF